MENPEHSGDYDGDDVIEWLTGSEARAVTKRLAARLGFVGSNFDSTEILADAHYGVWRRMQSTTPLVVVNPAAYGTTVIRHVLFAAARGRGYRGQRTRPIEDSDLDQGGAAAGSEVEDDVLERVAPDVGLHVDLDLRELIETWPAPKPWATSAALSYLTLTAHPDAYPDDVPRPERGSTPDQARCWAALWFAGQHDLFDPGRKGAAQRKKRQRYIGDVLEYVQRTYGRYRLEGPR